MAIRKQGKKQKEPRRHHTVPRFYLYRFSDGRRLQMVSRDRTTTKPVSVGDATVHRQFYSVRLKDRSDSTDLVERELGRVESLAAPIIAGLERGRFPQEEGRAMLSFYMALQLVRDPATRRMIEDMHTASARPFAKLSPPRSVRDFLRKQDGAEPSDERVDDTVRFFRENADQLRVDVPTEHYVKMMLDGAAAMAPLLFSRSWRVVRFSERLLLTSDSPVGLQPPDDADPRLGVGVGTAAAIFFPLDPQHLLLLTGPNDRVDATVMEGKPEWARDANRLIAFSSDRWIFHHPAHDPLGGMDIPAKPPAVRTVPASDGDGLVIVAMRPKLPPEVAHPDKETGGIAPRGAIREIKTPSASEIDKMLGRTDYIDHWLREARDHGKGRGWRNHLVEAIGILEVAFGREWLRSVAKQPSRRPFTRDDPRAHALGSWIATPSASTVSSVVELAVYLRRCARVPRIQDVLPMLKTPTQFTRAFVQLALGYRFLRLGVLDFEFEPPTDDGHRADHFFHHERVPYLVECYEPENANQGLYADLLHHSRNAIWAAANHVGRRIIATITIDTVDSVDASSRKRIEIEARDLISRLGDRGLETSTGPGYDLQILDTSSLSPQDVEKQAWSLTGPGDWLFNEKLIPVDQIPGISRGEPTNGTRLSWVVVKIKRPVDPVEALVVLADRLRKKVSQVRRRAEGAKGIVLVKSWLGRSAARRDPKIRPIVEAIHSKILVAHSDLAGVFLVERDHDKQARPFFGGLWMEGRDGGPLGGLFERLRLQEEQRDVLDDWS